MARKTNKRKDTLPFVLMEVFMKIATGMTKKEQLYWSRSPDELKKLLTKGKFEFLIANSKEGYVIPPRPQKLTKEALFREPFSKSNDNLGELQDLKQVYKGTSEVKAFDYTLVCELSTHEIIKESGGREAFIQTVFTPAQIEFLVLQQRRPSQSSPLLTDGYSNYFPIFDRDGRLATLALFWRKSTNRWEYWVHENLLNSAAYLRRGSKLFIIA